MGLRRRSREKAIQILYALEYAADWDWDFDECIKDYYSYFNLVTDMEDEETDFSNYLLYQVRNKREDIEKLIEKAAINWRIDRIAIIERNILRIAVAEFLDNDNGVPFKATINEAIDIAKKFGSKESASFVNGIVNKIADLLKIKDVKI
ncbi:transcription antitermination factor NusB [bacterium]|nr:transcription antitermination factor NusB [bacterium]